MTLIDDDYLFHQLRRVCTFKPRPDTLRAVPIVKPPTPACCLLLRRCLLGEPARNAMAGIGEVVLVVASEERLPFVHGGRRCIAVGGAMLLEVFGS